MKQEPDIVTPITRVSTAATVAPAPVSTIKPPARKRPPSASKNHDEDWVMETPKRNRPNRGSEIKKDDS